MIEWIVSVGNCVLLCTESEKNYFTNKSINKNVSNQLFNFIILVEIPQLDHFSKP